MNCCVGDKVLFKDTEGRELVGYLTGMQKNGYIVVIKESGGIHDGSILIVLRNEIVRKLEGKRSVKILVSHFEGMAVN